MVAVLVQQCHAALEPLLCVRGVSGPVAGLAPEAEQATTFGAVGRVIDGSLVELRGIGVGVMTRRLGRRLDADQHRLPTPVTLEEVVRDGDERLAGHGAQSVGGARVQPPAARGQQVGVDGLPGERVTEAVAVTVPNGPSAFTHIPTIMIAERLSEQFDAVT
jgi:hypothetical protein